MTRAIAGAGWVALVCSMAYGQAPADGKSADARLEFEVASVKPAAPQSPGRIMIGMRGGPGSGDPGRITYNNISLRDLMTDAYGVKRSQISGEPSWLDTERFDITAKVPPGATKERREGDAPEPAGGPVQAGHPPRKERDVDVRAGGGQEWAQN